MKKHSGFTLIELMVVMAIIAILATAGLSAYTGYLKKARDTERIAMARELQTAVEAFSVNGTPPTLAELTTYLAAEGIGWNIGTSQTRILGWLDTAAHSLQTLGIGNTFALIDDPMGGKPVCLDHLGNATMVCQFGYYTFSDGTYAISYGVETEGALINPHYSALTTPRTYGSFVGTNSAITVPMTDTTNIEAESLLTNIGITTTGGTLSDVGENTNGGGGSDGGGETCDPACTNGNMCTNGRCVCGGGVECTGSATCVNNTSCIAPDPCTQPEAGPGTVCEDETIYVNATLRTTANDAGRYSWVDCAACSGANTISACFDNDIDWNWVCPIDAEIPSTYHPAAQVCANLGAGWRLPDQGELNDLFQNSNCKSGNTNCDDTGAVVGGFSVGTYWSSTEHDIDDARNQNFYDGGQYGSYKDYAMKVRCVRSI